MANTRYLLRRIKTTMIITKKTTTKSQLLVCDFCRKELITVNLIRGEEVHRFEANDPMYPYEMWCNEMWCKDGTVICDKCLIHKCLIFSIHDSASRPK